MDIYLVLNQNLQWIALLFLVIVIGLLILYVVNKRRKDRLEDQFTLVKNMLQAIHPEKGIEENLDRMLEIVAMLAEAPTYTFYILDKKNQNYILKSVRYLTEDFGEVRPSYSGLSSFKAESYRPALSLNISKRVYEIKKIIEAEIPLFYIPVGEKGLILIGPLEHMKKSVGRNLAVLSEQMSYVLEGLIVSENIRTQAQVTVASGQALQKISNISMDQKMMMETLTRLCIKSIGAVGGFVIQKNEEDFQVIFQVGLDKDTFRELNEDSSSLAELSYYLQEKDFYFIRSNDEQYYRLPPYFAGAGMDTLTLINLGQEMDHIFVLWSEEDQENREEEIKITLRTMIDHVQTVIGHQSSLQMFSETYMDILKTLSRLVDNLNPYSVGYSELMSRYSLVIARQLKLDEEETKDIVLAAYLSNIGVLGLSGSLFEKEGKFTDEEYELSKLHSEVGASIVNVASGNERVAKYIMHHHERMDGNGYPDGLQEHEIPTGSKIIAVVQMFLAKIYGRKYRDPLQFNDALELLQSAAGAQLDEDIVDVFVKWFNKKRVDPSVAGRSLGRCSEMLAVPETICKQCPVYYKKDVHCWEVEDNLCHSHGKKCKTCIVRTEYMSRNEWQEKQA